MKESKEQSAEEVKKEELETQSVESTSTDKSTELDQVETETSTEDESTEEKLEADHDVEDNAVEGLSETEIKEEIKDKEEPAVIEKEEEIEEEVTAPEAETAPEVEIKDVEPAVIEKEEEIQEEVTALEAETTPEVEIKDVGPAVIEKEEAFQEEVTAPEAETAPVEEVKDVEPAAIEKVEEFQEEVAAQEAETTPEAEVKDVEPAAIEKEEAFQEEVAAPEAETAPEAEVMDVEPAAIEKEEEVQEEVAAPETETAPEVEIQNSDESTATLEEADHQQEATVAETDKVDESTQSPAEVELKNGSSEKEIGEIAVSEENDSEDNSTEHEEEHHEEPIDYTGYSKEELVRVIEELVQEDNIKKSTPVLKEIQHLFEEMIASEREEALKKFIKDGGVEDDFEYKHDDLDNRFDASQRLLRDRKHKFHKNQEQLKQENLEIKNQLLEELRNFIDSEETNTSINALKELQQKWKDVGMVPHNYVKTLWANYNALIDRFYDNRSIYFELKELDRKKNQTLKEELCVKAEALDAVESLNDAISQLNELHHDYKHIGPVPMEGQEALWQRFKAASDKVYAKRKVHIEEIKKELHKNLEAKKEVIDLVAAFANFSSDRINDWNAKTKEIIALQKKWETIGGLPREKAKEINKEFWGSFKKFFSSKNSFFKTLEGQREENLKKKEELVIRAEELKENEDWDTTAQLMKKLQIEWKDIGPVPQKKREDVFARFKAACDYFFENRRAKSKSRDSEYYENYQKKEEICKELLEMAKTKSSDETKLGELVNHWNEIGFVPKKSIKEIQQKFFDTLDKFLTSSSLDEEAREKWRITAKFSNLKGKPNSNSRLNTKEHTIRKQISQLESDISLWRNNLEFFAASKTADKLKHDFDQKIEKAEDQLSHLKDELKIIRQM